MRTASSARRNVRGPNCVGAKSTVGARCYGKKLPLSMVESPDLKIPCIKTSFI